jgi:hypothetical protein
MTNGALGRAVVPDAQYLFEAAARGLSKAAKNLLSSANVDQE